MATARPPGGQGNTPRATIGFDYSQLRNAPNVAREAGRAAARELSQAFRSLQNEQRIALEQQRQTTAAVRAQQAQITAATRAASVAQQQQARATAQVQIQQSNAATQIQIANARAAAQIQVQQARAAAQAQIQAQRAAAQGGGGGFLRGVAGAALGSLGGPVGAIAGAAAGGAVAAGVGLAAVEGGRFAIAASQLATAYDRQRVAAVSLAGSQSRLNELLAVYDRVTGGAIDRATALGDTTRLMAIGFADSTQELEQFVRAARGISVATGQQQDYVISQLQLAIANQSTMRLDQLGLGVEEVQLRIERLRASNSNLTKEMAYQQAVLGLAEEKFGALVDSAEAQATETERATRAWKDLRLEMGKDLKANVDPAAGALADLLEQMDALIERRRRLNNELNDLGTIQAREIQMSRGQQPFRTLTTGEQAWMADAGARTVARRSASSRSVPEPPNEEQTAALRRREEGFAEIERESTQSRLDATRSYERQRASTIANYEKQVAREAEDFGRQRALAERRHQQAILDVIEDSARQRAKWESEAARAIAESMADRDERIAEARADSTERIADVEEKFARDREKRERDYRRRLLDAAANLDAVAVREEQRRFRDEAKEAKDAYDGQLADERESLQERIDEANKAFAEAERQQRESLQRRLEEQTENDRLRIEEMRLAFEEQKQQEDEERAIRLQRQAEDHQDQLDEMARAHGERIQQIIDQAQEERDQFTEESNKFLEAVGIHNQAWLDEQERINDGVIKRHEELLAAERRALLTPGHPSLADPYVDRESPYVPPLSSGGSSVTNTRASTVNIQPGAIVIAPPANANYSLDERFAAFIQGVIADFFEDYPQ